MLKVFLGNGNENYFLSLKVRKKLKRGLCLRTHEDLKSMIYETASFDREFYDFISMTSLYLTPLRERKDDLELLVDYFLSKESATQGFLKKELSQKVKERLFEYHWPLNVGELRGVLGKIVRYNPKSHIISDLPEKEIFLKSTKEITWKKIEKIEELSLPLKDKLALIEREMILGEIERLKGNKSQAAKSLFISRESLRKKLLISLDILQEIKTNKIKEVA